jgi:hypothetical protein
MTKCGLPFMTKYGLPFVTRYGPPFVTKYGPPSPWGEGGARRRFHQPSRAG